MNASKRQTHLETSSPLRAVEDDHVDRPGVEVRQRMELTGTNRSIGLIALISRCSSQSTDDRPQTTEKTRDDGGAILLSSVVRPLSSDICFIFCLSPAWWLLRSDKTRSHPELGRQTLQRRWYYVSRPGRVGRCQACQGQKKSSSISE